MSRGFVREGDQEEPIIIPPRAPLPQGVVNYVTENGYQELLTEKESLLDEIKNLLKENDTEYRRNFNLISGKLNLLKERISSARIINLNDQPKDEIRFGATAEIQNGNKIMKFQIVGIDEADVRKNKIAFTAPLARAVTGKKTGESIQFNLGGKMTELTIMKISYL